MDPDLAGVEHADAQDVAVPGRAGADDLGEEADADAHQLALRPLLGLLAAQARVVDRRHRLAHRGRVVAGVVLPAERRVVGELLRPDEVLEPELGRIDPELLRQHVDHALDQVGRLGHPERAAVGDAARRLVGVDAIDGDLRGRDVVGAGHDREEAGRVLGRIGAGIERAVIGQHVAAQARDPAVPGRRELAGHVVVAGEGGRREVLDPVLDPLHRQAEHDRGDDRADVARIDADLVAEAAADVGRDDVDLGLGNAGQQRDHRAHHVRRLEGAPDRELALHLVHRGDAGAGLERAGVHALVDDHLLDRDLGAGEGALGRRPCRRPPR